VGETFGPLILVHVFLLTVPRTATKGSLVNPKNQRGERRKKKPDEGGNLGEGVGSGAIRCN
jgi:hypothetical protein